MIVCPRCGQENPDGFRLCGMCGTSLTAAQGRPRETRKLVSIVFTDVTGSTTLGERLDPESMRRVLERYFDAMSAVVERHGGTVEKFIGDAIMAVFGIPVVHEDDALRAVRAAAEMPAALEELNGKLEAEYGVRIASRIGVNSGEVVAGDPAAGQRYATGDAVNVAARLEQAAAPGDVLIGEETYRLVRDAVQVEPLAGLALDGKAEAVEAFRLLEVAPDIPGHLRRLDTPLVGRDRELRFLQDAFGRAVDERACHLFTVLGAPGVGKSRLVAEFLTSVDAHAARGRCLPYGEGITYWPVVEAVREAVGLAEQDTAEDVRSQLRDALGDEPTADVVVQRVLEALALAEGSASAEETFWALRKLFEALARQRPLVVVLDDIQWGEPTLLDCVEHFADWSRDAPILLLCMARPELLDVRPSWGGGKLNSTTVLLERLDEAQSDRLLVQLLAGGALDPATRARIGQAAEGNPLFIEEMVGMLIDDGLLERENGHWTATADLSDVPVPPTIRALLAARLDQLDGTERRVIERAAVEGQVFHQGAVAALAPDADAVGASLLGLVRRELIRPERPTFAGEDAFRFRHLLIRDAAYEALPKEERADLHERFAGWLEGKAGERAGEFAEIAGYHLEQAWLYRRELSPAAPQSELAARAGARLADAGGRAYARGDMPAAANLLGRATSLLPRESYERLELMPTLAAALGEGGRLLEARDVLGEAIGGAQVLGNPRLEWRARAADGWWRLNTDTEVDSNEVADIAGRAIAELQALGDDFGLAIAWRLESDVANARGNGARWIEALRRAFEHARLGGNRHEEWACLTLLGGAMFFGPTPVAEGIQNLEALREDVGDDLMLEGAILRPLGALFASQGQLDRGWSLIERSRSIQTELGLKWGLAGIPFMSGRIARLSGDLATAEREYRAAVQAYTQMAERGRLPTILAQLAAVVYELGRLDEAVRLADEAVRFATADDVMSHVGALMARGRAVARQGDTVEGERLARQGLALIEATDFHDEHSLTLLDLGEVLEVAARPEEAVPLVERALTLTRQKGNVLLERRARQRLGRLRQGGEVG